MKHMRHRERSDTAFQAISRKKTQDANYFVKC